MKQTLFASSPPAWPQPRRGGSMSMNERIQKRLRKDRPMTTISIRLPEDVIEDLKLLAPEMGFSITSSGRRMRSEEHTSELQSRPHLVCRLLLEKKNICSRS